MDQRLATPGDLGARFLQGSLELAERRLELAGPGIPEAVGCGSLPPRISELSPYGGAQLLHGLTLAIETRLERLQLTQLSADRRHLPSPFLRQLEEPTNSPANLPAMDRDDPYQRAEDFLPPTDDLGLAGYEVLSTLGEGGFGRVYTARQEAFDRTVAIKVLSASGFREETARRFERECRAVGALSGHPNIVTIYDSGITAAGKPYIVMDHMSQGSLGDILTRGESLDWERSVEIIIKVAGAVETAHRSGILHRDVKPENILLSAFSEPKLADFGVASIPGGYQTHTGAITASLSHAAPEVLEGHKATRAVDVYALGSTLFALITGHAAFESEEGAGLQSLIAKTLTQPVPDLRGEGVPEDVCAAIEKAMAKDPTGRFASAEALGAALQKAQANAGFAVTELPVPVAEGAVITYATDLEAPSESSRTAIRQRRELTPPLVAPPKKRLVWRSPITAGIIALVLLGSSTGVIALRDRDERELPAEAPAGTGAEPDEQEIAAVPDDDDRRRPTRPRKLDRPDRKKRNQGGSPSYGGSYAYGGGTGGSSGGSGGGGYQAPAPGSQPPSSGGSGTSGSGGGGGGSSQPKPPPPPPPNEQPATLAFYHFSSNDGRYLFTADGNLAAEQSGKWSSQRVIANVWENPGAGLIQLCPTPDRCEDAYISTQPPKKGGYKTLYYYYGEHGRFYLTDPSAAPSGADLGVAGYTR